MNFQEYLSLCDDVINDENPHPPYDKPDYMNYTKLNIARMKRWMKTMQLNEFLVSTLMKLPYKQHWIIIVEPWCGDVSQSLPFLARLAEQSPMISYELQLRDSEPFLINSYLTRGTKSIPKLVARDEKGNDLFTWGARPQKAQELMNELKSANTDFETIKIRLQNWYNEDKGNSLQKELLELVNHIAIEKERAGVS